MVNKTQIMTTSEDKGKKIYRQKIYYTLILEQDVIANTKDEADKKLGDEGGIDYHKIDLDITHESCNVTTYFVDAEYDHGESIYCIGKIDEDGDVIDHYEK